MKNKQAQKNTKKVINGHILPVFYETYPHSTFDISFHLYYLLDPRINIDVMFDDVPQILDGLTFTKMFLIMVDHQPGYNYLLSGLLNVHKS